MKLNTIEPYKEFNDQIEKSRKDLLEFLATAKKENKTVLGLEASTKGNVILQYCNITEKDMSAIAEVNENKFNHYTPGSRIKIIAETEARAMKPDYFFVFPWHFKENIIEREAKYLSDGGTLVFPLPTLELIKKKLKGFVWALLI